MICQNVIKRMGLIPIVAVMITGVITPVAGQPDYRMLAVTEEGIYYRGRWDVTDWEPGEDFIYLSAYYMPWQGQDSLDFEIDLYKLTVNDQVVGWNLVEAMPTSLVDSSKILTVQIDSDHFDLLDKFPNLQAVSLVNVHDSDLVKLEELDDLRALDLAYVKLTDQGTTYLAQLENLRVLNLAYTRITDEGLKNLSNLTNLRSLDLESTEVTDQGLVYLEDLKDLRSLNLFRTPAGKTESMVMRGQDYKVGNQGAGSLSGFSKLSYLNLHGSDITDSGVAEIAKMNSLRHLDLTATGISDAAIPELSKMTWLRTLDIKGTNISSEGLELLRSSLPDCEINITGMTKDRRGLVKP